MLWCCCKSYSSDAQKLLQDLQLRCSGAVARITAPMLWCCCKNYSSDALVLLQELQLRCSGAVARITAPMLWCCCKNYRSECSVATVFPQLQLLCSGVVTRSVASMLSCCWPHVIHEAGHGAVARVFAYIIWHWCWCWWPFYLERWQQPARPVIVHDRPGIMYSLSPIRILWQQHRICAICCVLRFPTTIGKTIENELIFQSWYRQ